MSSNQNLESCRFDPEPGSLRSEAIYLAIGCVVVIPAFCRWKGVSWQASLAISIASFIGVIATDVYKIRIRGRDHVLIGPEEIQVHNRRKSWSLRWTEISRVYMFKEQLVFETPPPHRRWYLSLGGHEPHKAELFAQISEKARAKNLAWFDTLAGLLG